MLLDFPLSAGDYNQLYLVMIFIAVFTLLLIIIYLMVGEEREETEV